MKIIILVLSSDNINYKPLNEALRKTCFSGQYDDIEIFYYYGNSDRLYQEGDVIYCPVEENVQNIGRKTISAFEWVLNNKSFDYIFRTNESSYIDLLKLLVFIEDKPRTNFYCATPIFVNGLWVGAGVYFLSRDVAEKISKYKQNIHHELPDDVALGFLMHDLNVPLYGMEKTTLGTWDNIDFFNLPEESIDFTKFFYRCRCHDRKDDIRIMEKLHEMLNNKR
jgi:hypothetical protein